MPKCYLACSQKCANAGPYKQASPKRKEEQTRESEEADRLLQAAGFGDIFLMQHDKEALCMADEATKANSIAAAS